MIQTIITCDVCKTEERGPYPKEVPGKYWKGEVAGGRWYKLSIYNEPSETAISEVTIDVCPECAEELADQLGMDELPPPVEDEEDNVSTGGLVITSPFPVSDDSTAWKWDKYQWTNTSANTPIWPIDFSA